MVLQAESSPALDTAAAANATRRMSGSETLRLFEPNKFFSFFWMKHHYQTNHSIDMRSEHQLSEHQRFSCRMAPSCRINPEAARPHFTGYRHSRAASLIDVAI